MEAKPSYQQLAEINKRLEAENKEMQWLREKEQIQETEPYAPFYGDVTELNTQRTILDSVGKKNLQDLTSELMDLLETSVAIYEANGDYAYGNFNSDWCRLMDPSSRKLCNTKDNKTALNSDKWLCHYCCWNDSAKPAIRSKKPTDINCVGGIKLYAEPIFCGNEVIGTINIGYGNPPKDEATLRKLSKKFSIDFDLLKANSEKYNPRPDFIIQIAKKRLKSIAKLIGEIVARKQTEESLKEINKEINIKNEEIAAQNEELEAQNEELEAQNEEIRVQNEEYQQLNEELRHTNKHLHHAKEEIKESNKLFDLFFHESLEGFFFMMLDEPIEWNDSIDKEKTLDYVFAHQRITKINDAMLQQYGAKKEDFLKLTPNDFFSHDLKHGREVWKKFFDEGKLHIDTTEKKLDGTDMIIIGNYNCLYDEKGRITGHFGVQRDVTERKIAEEQLKSTLNKLESIFTNSPNLISIIDSKGTYVKVSYALAKTIGLEPDEIAGKTIYDLLPEELADNFKFTIDRVIKEKCNIRKTDIIPVDGKDRFFESFVFPVKQNADQTEMIGVISVDITDLKEVEQGLLKAKQQAEAANSAKSEFLANMSHEIRIPLYGVKGFNELLMSTDLNPTQKEYVEKSRISANMLMDLINDILDLSKIEADKLELEEVRTDVARLAENIFYIFQHEAEEKNLNIKLNIDDKLPGFVFVDPTKLRQVLMNLISNAVKFTEEGSIEIKIKFKKKIAKKNKGTIYFSVKDTGIGISKEDQTKLFKVFSQADTSTTRKYGGSGLGLVISYKIIEKMGSKLKLKSIPGKGSEFYFSLDREYKDGAKAKVAEKMPEKKLLKIDPVILVVEDVEIIMFLVKTILKQIVPQAHIVEAFNGVEGIKKYKEVNPDFVLLDIQMPVKDGYAVAKEIRQYEKENNMPRKPVIALTARAVKGERERCLAAGMDDFMTKPIGQNDLIDALDEYLTEPPKSKKLKAAAVDKDKSSPGYEHFNKQELIDKFGGDSKECEELLKMALEKIPEYIADLKKEIERNDLKSIRKAAHKLKGAALFVSFNQLGTLAKKLEHNEKHDIGVVKGVLEEIEREFEEVKKVVS